ncbi:MAG: glycoside hydrolase family 44 protein [Oscillospiraceae bacterium]|nr:glycoside hydrolase family 44 protein [Oscillospiraceae bacterium]
MKINLRSISRIGVLAILLPLFGAVAYAEAETPNTGWNDTGRIDVRITASRGHVPISPYIYGLSADGSLSSVTVHAAKNTGAELSSYNWESNFSNTGEAGNNANNMSLIRGYSGSALNTPALNTQMLVAKAGRNNIPARFVTLQMMGFVARDSLGEVTLEDVHERFDTVLFGKHGDYLSVPDVDDGVVYMDEYVSFLTNSYGRASAGGINGYFLDSKPEEWVLHYPVLELPPLTADSLLEKSEQLAAAVKKIDRSALVLGPSVSGLGAYVNLHNISDTENYADTHSWFIDYYLDRMKQASDTAGVRLLDVLDLHYITEANDFLREPVVTSNTIFSNSERMQATRLLWDGSYTENSVSAIRHKQHTPIIPTLMASIRIYYPGTKLSFSEYNFGGGGHISGAIAQADALGIFARYGVYMACLAPNTAEFAYQKSAINLYTNYDGEGSSFGDTMVRTDNGGDNMSSVYAAISGGDESTLKAVLINKNNSEQKQADIKIEAQIAYDSAEVYSINGRSFEIRKTDFVSDIENNSFTYLMEPLTVYLFVFGTDGEITSTPSYIVTGATATQAIPAETPLIKEGAEDVPVSDAQNEEAKIPAVTEAGEFEEYENGSGALSPGDEDSHVPLPLKIVTGTLAAAALLGIIYVFVTDVIHVRKPKGEIHNPRS